MKNLPIILICLFCLGINAKSQTDIFSKYEKNLDILKKNEPVPVLQVSLYEPTVEFIQVVNSNYLLVATGKLKKSGQAMHGPIILYDMASGREKWRINRTEDINTSYTVLKTERSIIVLESSTENKTFIAFDIQSGKQKWEILESVQSSFSFFPEQNKILLNSVKGNSSELSILNPESGKQIWHKKLSFKMADNQKFEIIFDQLWAVGNELKIFDISNGKLLYQNNKINSLCNNNYPIEYGGEVVIGIEDSVLVKLNRKGEIIWKKNFDFALGIFNIYKSMVLVNYRQNNHGKHHIEAISLTDSKPVWKKKLPGALRSRFLVMDNILYLTAGEELLKLNVNDGSLRIKVKLSCNKNRISDRFVSYPEHLVLIQESSISAFNWSNLKTNWTFDIKDNSASFEKIISGYQFELNYPRKAIQKIKDQYCSPGDAGRSYESLNKKLFNEYKKTNAQIISTATFDYSWLDKQRKINLNRMHRTGSISTSTYIDLYQSQVAFAQSMAAANMLSASINVAIGMKEAADEITKEASKKIKKGWFPFHLEYLASPYYTNIYKDFCVRSFIRDGFVGLGPGRYGFIIINLRNAKWAEITTSSLKSAGLNNININILPASFFNNGKYVITRGVGLQSNKWKQGLGFGDKLSLIPSFSLLKYEVNDLKFEDYNKYKNRYKHICGNYVDAETALAKFKVKKSTLEELKQELGEPSDVIYNQYYWKYAIEINGEINYDGIKCEFSKKGKLKSIKRHSYPYDWVKKEPEFNKRFYLICNKIFNID